jgi:ferric-dicitrate binding protein FerR (iron transport regulator)
MSRSASIAALILKKIKQDPLTGPEQTLLTTWAAESDQNRLLLEELTDEVKLGNEFREYYKAETAGWHKITQQAGFDQQRERFPPEGFLLKNKWAIAVAAILVAGLISLLLYFNLNLPEKVLVEEVPVPEPVTIATGIGKRRTVTLPDGSVVELNAVSRLVYPPTFNDRERKVVLYGEGYFDIVPKPGSAFVVQVVNPVAGKIPVTINVSGTEFNVKSYEDGTPVITTVVKGSVKVQQGTNTRSMETGQQVRADRNGLVLVKAVNVNNALAWKNGAFNFDSTSIRSMMHEIARWYGVKVACRGDSDKVFFASFPRYPTLTEALGVLKETGDISFIVEDSAVIAVIKK